MFVFFSLSSLSLWLSLCFVFLCFLLVCLLLFFVCVPVFFLVPGTAILSLDAENNSLGVRNLFLLSLSLFGSRQSLSLYLFLSWPRESFLLSFSGPKESLLVFVMLSLGPGNLSLSPYLSGTMESLSLCLSSLGIFLAVFLWTQGITS